MVIGEDFGKKETVYLQGNAHTIVMKHKSQENWRYMQ